MIVPVPVGGVKATLIADVLNTVAIPIVGGLGVVVTEFDTLDDADDPPELVAVTVNVYDVFGVNPDTIIGVLVPVDVTPVLLVTL